MSLDDQENIQLQEEEDTRDFYSALLNAEAYQLLDDVIHVLDELCSKQASN